MKILSKKEFFRLWELGVLGNRTRIWYNPFDAYRWGMLNQQEDRYFPEIGFREIGKAGGGAWEKVSWADVPATARRWKLSKRNFICDDTCPNHLTILCGEVARTYRGLEGTLAVDSKYGIRDSIRRNLLIPRTGSVVLYLLNKYMDPSSKDDLYDLLDLFPDATVEFSCFSVDVGIFPGRNTIFWETRNY